jgi:molecular chaperone DnaK
LVHSVTKNLSEHGDKLDDATKAEIQKAIDDAKTVENSTDLEVVKAKNAALSSAAMKIGTAMYGKGGNAATDAAAADSNEPQDATVKDANDDDKNKENKK